MSLLDGEGGCWGVGAVACGVFAADEDSVGFLGEVEAEVYGQCCAVVGDFGEGVVVVVNDGV